MCRSRSLNYNFEYITFNYNNIDVGNMSSPRFVDIDGDGDYDLFIGNESYGLSNGFEGDFTFYDNQGTSTNPDFHFMTSQYLFADMSAGTRPYIIDIDGDNVDELLVSIIGGEIVLFENEGTVENPNWIFADSSFAGINWAYAPSFYFADLDNDDDYDAVVSHGSFTSFVKIYTNTGTSTNPVFTLSSTIISSPTTNFIGVQLCDIDDDDDDDLFLGTNIAQVQFWENTGTVSHPDFRLNTDDYLPQFAPSNFMVPRFTDWDHDGDYDLLFSYGPSGNDTSFTYLLTNVGTPANAEFVLSDTLLTVYENEAIGSQNFPTGAFGTHLCDADNDGDMDMYVGDSGGALIFFRNLENPFQAELSIIIEGNDIILTWGNVADAVEYQIFYRDIPYFTPTGIPQAIVFPPDTVWTDEGILLVDPKRFYRIIVETN